MTSKSVFILFISVITVAVQAKDFTDNETREINNYGQMYKTLIQNNVYYGDRNNEGVEFKGKQCRVNFKLLPDEDKKAILKEVSVLSGDTELCKKAVYAVKSVEFFPLPEEGVVRDKLMNINLTLAPLAD